MKTKPFHIAQEVLREVKLGKCRECRFWVCFWSTAINDDGETVPDEEEVGYCHRYPPVALTEFQQRFRGHAGKEPPIEDEYGTPTTLGTFWCGEFRLKEN